MELHPRPDDDGLGTAERHETRYAKAGDVHIAYQVVGDGPVDLVHIPGWASHLDLHWTFPRYAHLLNRLASFSRLIVFDKRGTGLSDPVANPPTHDERMDDIRAVMDAAGSERAILFGECEGAPLCVLFAATHPERTEGLVLYGAMPSTGGDSRRWVDTSERLHEAVRDWGQGKMVDVFAPSTAGSARVRKAMAAYERASVSPAMADALFESLRDIDVSEAARNIDVPTLIMHRRDDFVPIGPARELAGLIGEARFVELEGADHALSVGDTEAVVGEIEEFVTGSRRQPEPRRALLTVLFTDIVGSTELAGELGDARWRQLLDEHNRLIRRELSAHHGHEVKTTGDGFLASFDGPARAIWCACAIADGVRGLGIEIRAGVHTGETELLDEDIGGVAVHIGARVMALAGAGEVLVTSTVRDLVAGSGIGFQDRGVHELKGVPGEWRVLAVESSADRPVLAGTPRARSLTG